MNSPSPPAQAGTSAGKICIGVFLGIVMAVFFLFFLMESPRAWSRYISPRDAVHCPEYILVTRTVPVQMSYGDVWLPGGMILVLSRNGHYAGVVEAQYRGEIIRIPLEATTLAEDR